MKKIFLLLFFFLPLFAQQSNEERLLLDTGANLETPIILSNKILFYYRGNAEKILLSGDFNNWSNNFQMIEARSNLWIAVWTNRLFPDSYSYRLNVDGFWIPDPNNIKKTTDSAGQILSLLEITNTFEPNKSYPYWISNDIYQFRHFNTNARNVSVAGDFNHWNPYSHPMKYIGAGYFEIELELSPKKIYTYSFIEDGIWTFDENNKNQYRNKLNRPVSAFYTDTTNTSP